MRLFALSPDDAREHWADFEPLFVRMQHEHDGPIAEVVHELAMRGNAQIWGFADNDENVCGVLATEVMETARGKVCNIMTAFGGAPLPLQERMMDEIGKWARSLGCVAVSLRGRKGWLRRFRRFHQTGIVAEWQL